ncbi:Gfo/Idh/MocA family oxidoreductase [Erythrobacter sp. F6033]|uniref:Gfo/Idh/MocA family protein n=1 Tax=Erythrobacter sp. F6033 TaxID=2926401 RepID=UPI001FF5F026|nr:Gfo/Idh/MocA family oxidoreductase [Erythrobacter sp. F6033]MCK0127638.1 Gfo/Idh/MocA family oxidoreductase [Erythrobacter sp. F6033]
MDSKRMQMGMVGGGAGAFIGAVHRMAAALDGEIDLVCGAFSRDPEICKQTGRDLGLAEDRCYSDTETMLTAEAARSDAMQCLSIVTPNHAHVPMAKAAALAGSHVISDKPAGISLAEVEQLAETLSQTKTAYALTHTYLGYPMVWQARAIAARPEFGAVRKVIVNYTQGWLAQPAEKSGNKQAAWRVDPALAGPAGALGDIGSHAHSLAEFIAHSRMDTLSARLRSHLPDRPLDDDGAIDFTLENGATGTLISSQICAGDENDLFIRVYGENASLEWRQMEPNTLIERRGSGETIIHRAGIDKPLHEEALSRCRLPSGHPEGYVEAFANLYRNTARAVRDGAAPISLGVPGIAEALRGMAFLEASIASSADGGAWTDVKAPSVGPDLKGLLA